MIGIITPYKVNNYGTKLQAFAMQKLFEKYDEVEIVGFIPATDRRIMSILGKIYLKVTKCFVKKDVGMDSEKFKERKKAINDFDKFYNFGERINGNKDFIEYSNKYSTVVCGSDQLWAPSNVIADYFTLSIIPKPIHKMSYAASFGVSEVPKSMKNKYKKFLNYIDDISVREDQGKKIVKDLTDKDVPVVLDPTLMVDKSTWNELAEKSKLNDNKYIFCYFLGTSKSHRFFAENLARKTGYKLLTIPHFKEINEADENFGDEQLYNLPVEDFVNLIKNAEYVCTDSFHGSVFSIIFGTQVAVFERFNNNSTASTNSRIYTLLSSLKMENQLFEDENNLEKFINAPIDFSQVHGELENLKFKSKQYVDKALIK